MDKGKCDQRATPVPRQGSGFTLVELMITLALMGILLAVAVPSFQSIAHANRLSAGANDIVLGIQLARSEAIRRNARVVFCPSNDGTTCTNSAAWTGWMVATDANDDGDFGDADEVIRFEQLPPQLQVQGSPAIAAAAGRVTFPASGMAAGTGGAMLLNATISVCALTTLPAENTRLVHVVSGGRVAIGRADNGGLCPQPANAEV